MATEERHITRMLKTEALFKANGDRGQSAILTDQNEEWVYYNDDKSLLYYAAAQKTWNGAVWAYVNNDFGQVTLHDDLLVDEYIKRVGGTDDLIRFENDKITIAAGGADAMIFEDDQVYSGLKKFGFGKTTLESWDSNWVGIQFGGLSALAAIYSEVESSGFYFLNNCYFDGAWKRISNDEAGLLLLQDGKLSFSTNAAGTAGEAFTPTNRMLLTSADLSTASVQIGLNTATPLLNVGSASGDFTGDGIHIKADVANDRKAFLVLEGAAGGLGGIASQIVFADIDGDSNEKLMRISFVDEQIIYFDSLNDDTSFKKRLLNVGTDGVVINSMLADVDFEVSSDNKSAWKIDAGTDKIYSELLNDGKSGTPPENFSYLIVNHVTGEVSAYTLGD